MDTNKRGGDPEIPKLFPTRPFGGQGLSLQGDLAGYSCNPRFRFDDITEYDAVEATLWGDAGRLNPHLVPDFPEHLLAHFDEEGIARMLGKDAVAEIEAHLRTLQADGIILEEVAKNALWITDAEISDVLGTIESAIFSHQGGMDRTLDFGKRLLALAVERGIDVSQYDDLATYSGFNEPKGPGKP